MSVTFCDPSVNHNAMSDENVPNKECCPCPPKKAAEASSTGSEVTTLLLATGGVVGLSALAIILGVITYKMAKARMYKMK